MKNKEQFDNSIKVLVKAYLEGILTHFNICACAVGNLIADGMGYRVDYGVDLYSWTDKKGDDRFPFWYGGRFASLPEKNVLAQFNSTGYALKEILIIEKAFESVNNDKDGYKGLCAVFDVLVQIHKGSDKQLELAKIRLKQNEAINS